MYKRVQSFGDLNSACCYPLVSGTPRCAPRVVTMCERWLEGGSIAAAGHDGYVTQETMGTTIYGIRYWQSSSLGQDHSVFNSCRRLNRSK